jgi:hypothetical protein
LGPPGAARRFRPSVPDNSVSLGILRIPTDLGGAVPPALPRSDPLRLSVLPKQGTITNTIANSSSNVGAGRPARRSAAVSRQRASGVSCPTKSSFVFHPIFRRRLSTRLHVGTALPVSNRTASVLPAAPFTAGALPTGAPFPMSFAHSKRTARRQRGRSQPSEQVRQVRLGASTLGSSPSTGRMRVPTPEYLYIPSSYRAARRECAPSCASVPSGLGHSLTLS